MPQSVVIYAEQSEAYYSLKQAQMALFNTF